MHNVSDPGSGMIPCKIKGLPKDLTLLPHGIDLWEDEKSHERILFVANHALSHDSVVTLNIEFAGSMDSVELVFRRMFKSDKFVSINDVVGVNPDEFYFTNDHSSSNAGLNLMSDVAALATGQVVYVRNDTTSVAVAGLRYANGIAVSPSGKTVYVPCVLSKSIHVFDRDVETGALRERQVVYMSSHLDNVSIDKYDGSLWIGAHFQLIPFLLHASDNSKRSPSHVIKADVDPQTEDITEFHTVFMSHGTDLSASSTALYSRKHHRLLISGVFDPKILSCPLR